mgnify:CR=1 FL=1
MISLKLLQKTNYTKITLIYRKRNQINGVPAMVFTPLHYPQAYLLYKINRNKLSYSGLLIGSFLPDLEVPILVLLGYEIYRARLILHCIIGVILFSWAIGLMILPIYRIIVKKLIGRNISVKYLNYIASVELSSLIHVIIDAMHHKYNPLLWPITVNNITTLIPFGKQEAMHIILHASFLILTTMCIYDMLKHNSRNLRNLIIKIIYNHS